MICLSLSLWYVFSTNILCTGDLKSLGDYQILVLAWDALAVVVTYYGVGYHQSTLLLSDIMVMEKVSSLQL